MNAEVRNQLAREVLSATLSSSSSGEKASESSIEGGGDVFAANAIVASIKSGEYSRALKDVLYFAIQPLSSNDDDDNRGEGVLEEKEFALFLAGVCGLCLHQRANACGPPLHLEEEEEEEEGFANAILQAFRDDTFRDGGNGGFALNDAQNADGLLHGDVDGVFGSSRASIGEMDEEEKDRRRAKRRKRRAFEKVLSRDGEDASGRIEHPECLALAVECLVNSKQMMKRLEYVERDETLDVSARPSPMGRCRRAAAEALDGEETTNSNEEFHVVRDWFAARCALAHQRVLFGRTVTLRKRCLGFFARALEGLSRASSLVGDDEKKKIEDAHYLYGTCLVEASLMEH